MLPPTRNTIAAGAALIFLAMGTGLSGSAARAGSKSTTLLVSANVVASCIVAAKDVNFGAYVGQEVRATGAVSARCNRDVAFHIALDAGTHYDGSWRAVSNNTHRIRYGLYAPDGQDWGDRDYAGTYFWGTSVAGNGTGDWQFFPVSGVLFAGVTGIPPGIYSDVVTVTVYF